MVAKLLQHPFSQWKPDFASMEQIAFHGTLMAPQAFSVEVTEFWSTDTYFDYSKGSAIMSRDRWYAISCCLAIYDPKLDPTFSVSSEALGTTFRGLGKWPNSSIKSDILQQLEILLLITLTKIRNHTTKQLILLIFSRLFADRTSVQGDSSLGMNNA